jgi:ABC-type branched-subunit amino acid transport system substrate-binding protein
MLAPVLDRRAFLVTAARACGALVLGGALAPGATPLRLLLVVPAGGGAPASAARGVTLGVEEAARTGQLVGRTAQMRTAAPAAAEAALRRGGIGALVGGFDEESAREMDALAGSVGIPFLNVGASADSLRGARCSRGTFHVEASARMYADALAAGGKQPPGTRAVLWHPKLERFGASQLNARFRARFGTAMDGPAWAGWLAAKALWEASLRARSTEPAALAAYLENGSTQFDGHKGWPLSFRAWDHQLRQPLYLSAGQGAASRVVAELPARPDPEQASRDLLDRYGATARTTTCQRLRGGTP